MTDRAVKWFVGILASTLVGLAAWDYRELTNAVRGNTQGVAAQEAVQVLILEELREMNKKIDRVIEREIDRGK